MKRVIGGFEEGQDSRDDEVDLLQEQLNELRSEIHETKSKPNYP